MSPKDLVPYSSHFHLYLLMAWSCLPEENKRALQIFVFGHGSDDDYPSPECPPLCRPSCDSTRLLTRFSAVFALSGSILPYLYECNKN